MEADTVLGDVTVQDVVVYYAVGQDVAAAPSIPELTLNIIPSHSIEVDIYIEPGLP